MIQAYRSAGSSAAFKVLIKQLKSDKLSNWQAINIFTSMNVGAYDPIMVSELIVSIPFIVQCSLIKYFISNNSYSMIIYSYR